MSTRHRSWTQPYECKLRPPGILMPHRPRQLITTFQRKKGSHHLNETLLLDACFEKLCARVCLGILQTFAVDLLLGTSFIHKFNCRIFQAERKIVSWHLQPVFMLETLRRSNFDVAKSAVQHKTGDHNSCQADNKTISLHHIRVA